MLAEPQATGDVNARNALVVENRPLAISVARKYFRRFKIPFDDALSEAFVALIGAAMGFDERHGVQFSTYSTRVMWTRLWTYSSRFGPLIRVPEGAGVKPYKVIPFSSWQRYRDRPFDVADGACRHDQQLAELEEAQVRLRRLLDAIEQLKPQERAALRMRYMQQMPVSEIAAQAGVSHGRINQILREAIGQLRELFVCQTEE
jgi:RNA polymerase sigma factor (sigma-70 family)